MHTFAQTSKTKTERKNANSAIYPNLSKLVRPVGDVPKYEDYAQFFPFGNPKQHLNDPLLAGMQEYENHKQKYVNAVKNFGNAELKSEFAQGKYIVLAVRTPTNRKKVAASGVYDDEFVLMKCTAGKVELIHLKANTEPSAQYDGKPNGSTVDFDKDGTFDAGRLVEGNYKFSDNGKHVGNDSWRAGKTQAAKRDINNDGNFDETDPIDFSGAATTMLVHAGGDKNTWSAGCLTMPPDQFKVFNGKIGKNSFQLLLIQHTQLSAVQNKNSATIHSAKFKELSLPLAVQSRHLVEQSQLHNGGIRYGTSFTQERLNN
jgi:hypothetical protein